MSAGYGISGHKNSFSSRVKIGNYVEDQYGAKLARESVACPMNGKTEVQDKFGDPSAIHTSETVPPTPEAETQSYVQRTGLSYNLLFPHGPPGKEGTSAEWCTTNQMLHGPTPVQSRRVFENGSEIGTAHIDTSYRNEKTIELQKKLAREKRLQESYVSTTQASSALVRKK
ncbi:Aste57867_12769 [Aphanomyces stellatus]|uniref:Aste57867_12769 protein n=1 Tax=Aphanomyces stellatus TaxID=120398 RepID=A0A485KWH6_9STRA|nr:hypothetical protein As57867_012721 [Aphanomyces stellatus]VFT89618.1 Aste57867_12769 [Aphanomyces stellatus]